MENGSDQAEEGSSIEITKKTDRSAYMFCLQHLVKPLNVRVIKPKKDFPAGSPQLEAPKKTTNACNIRERRIEDVYIYDLIPKQRLSNDKPSLRRLYYFCGGAWRMPPSGEHWVFCTELAARLDDTIVSVVSYPLAPNSPAPVAFPQLMRMYKRLLLDAEEAGVRVMLGGDSSGGNIALCLALALLAEDATAPIPAAIMAICPSTDCRKGNPEMKKVEKHDPILRIPFVTENANAWRGEWDASDPRVSPLLADVSLFASRGVQCHGVVAGYDILGPDAVLFRDKCEKAGVHGEWMDWDKQMHCFPLAWRYKLPDSVEVFRWILDVLQRT